MSSMQTIKRFANNKVANKIGITVDDVQRCLAMWAEPHRFYHGLNHLFKILDTIDVFWEDGVYDSVESREMIEIIALFHDVIYDPKAKDNEVKSADLFSGLATDSSNSLTIYQAILDTDYGNWREPTSEESKEFRLLDWTDPLYHSSMFDLLTAEKQLLKEYQYVNYVEYKENRLKFIKYALEQSKSNEDKEMLYELHKWVESYRPNIGVYAGSFNPFHIGHLNILEQAERVFDKVIILAAKNPDKGMLESFGDIDYVLPYHEIVRYDGLTSDYLDTVRSYADVTLVRGLRNGYDLQYESNFRRYMEEMGEVEVVYYLSGTSFQHISSSDVRGLYKLDEAVYNQYIPSKYSYCRK